MNKRAARLRLAVQAPAITTEQSGTQSARERAVAAEPLGDPPLSPVRLYLSCNANVYRRYPYIGGFYCLYTFSVGKCRFCYGRMNRERIKEVIKQANVEYRRLFREGVGRVRRGELKSFSTRDVKPYDDVLADALIDAVGKEYRQSRLENIYKRTFRNMKVYYIYGSAGCGKTSYVFQKHGYDDVYRTTNYEFGWIDDYNSEKILFFDEFRSSFKISEILDYLDGQPIRIRGRRYNRVACYDTVYIVSNLSLKEQYTNIQQSEQKTWAAFCRRITAVYDFDKSKDIPVNKFTGELKKPPTLIEIVDDGDISF